MKALKILKENRLLLVQNDSELDFFAIDEAISELEALQQHVKDLEEENKKGFQALHCPSCQGGGCTVCGESGFVFGRSIESQLSSNPLQLTYSKAFQAGEEIQVGDKTITINQAGIYNITVPKDTK